MSSHRPLFAALALACVLVAAACTQDVTAPARDAAAPSALYAPLDTTSPDTTSPDTTTWPSPIVCEDSVQSGYGSGSTGGLEYCSFEYEP